MTTRLAANREFYLSTREFIEKNPDFLPALVPAVNSAGQWATDKPSEVAAYLAKEVGMDPQILEPIIRREPWGFRPVDAGVIADQQAIADLFYSLKLLPGYLPWVCAPQGLQDSARRFNAGNLPSRRRALQGRQTDG